MARLGRSTPVSHGLTNWQNLGPHALEGPQPPQPVVTTIRTTLVAHRTREAIRHFPLQGWNGATVQGLGTTTGSTGGVAQRLLGPRAPAVTLPLPDQNQTTLRVKTAIWRRLEQSRRVRFSRQKRPVVVLGPAVVTTLEVKNVTQQTRAAYLRRSPRSILRAPTVVTVTSAFAPGVASLATVRPRKPLSALRPPATLEPYAVQLEEETVKVALVQTRPRRTLTRLLPPATLEAASTQLQERTLRAKLARIRPARTRAAVQPPATLEPYSVALEERTLRSSLTQTRPRPTTTLLSPPATLEPESVLLEEETIRVTLARIRPAPTVRKLRPPATLEPASVALAERTIRTLLTRIRPRTTRTRLAPPTALQTFSGFPPITVVTRPRKTTSWFTRTPLTAPAVTTIRALLARTRPQPTNAVLAPPATLEPFSVELRERIIVTPLIHTRPRATRSTLVPPTTLQIFRAVQPHTVTTRPRPTQSAFTATPLTVPAVTEISTQLARIRPRPTTAFVAPPATLEPYSVEQRERTITVWLTRLFRRPTHARLAPPIFYAATSAIRIALGGRTRVEAVRRAPHYKLRPPTVVIVPSVEQREETILVVLAEFVRRLVRPRLRPPTVTAPAETKIHVRLAPARRPKPESRLTPPTVVNEHVEAPVVKPIVKLVAVSERGSRIRRGPTSRLVPPGPPRIKGVACLIDLPANLACLVDQLAAAACLADQLAAEGCLSDGLAAQGCLADKGAACAILSEE